LAELFQTVYQHIDALPKKPQAKEELKETAHKVQREAAKGKEADEEMIEGWLQSIAVMAPDILEVTANTLLNPVAGVATAIQKIAEKAKQTLNRS
jgi:hypothetical protein